MKNELSKIAGILAKNQLINSRFSDSNFNLHSDEGRILQAVLSPIKYRMTTLSIASMAPQPLLPVEMRGIAYFTALVAGIDDLTDAPEFPKFDDPTELKDHLLNQSLNINRENIKVNDLTDLIYHSFPETTKQREFYHFINGVLEAQLHSKAAPGTYGYDQVLKYRNATTRPYARVGAILAGCTNPIDIKQYEDGVILWQIVDDASDIFSDGKAGLLNMFIGLATDKFPLESAILENALSSGKDFESPWLRNSATNILKQMPNACKAYDSLFKKALQDAHPQEDLQTRLHHMKTYNTLIHGFKPTPLFSS